MKLHRVVQVQYVDLVQARAVDSGDEVLYIVVCTLDVKVGKSRKDCPCYWRRVYSIRARSSRLEAKGKNFETGQCG